jgi:hypothetical protein
MEVRRMLAGAAALLLPALQAAGQDGAEIERDAVGSPVYTPARPMIRPPVAPGVGETWRPRSGDLLLGKPIGSPALKYDGQRSATDKAGLRLNNQKDRLLGEFTNCEAGKERQRECDLIRFSFPQLSVDAERKTISIGGDVVGTFTGRDEVSLNPGYRLRLEKVKAMIRRDTGGDYVDSPETRVAMYLEKV